MGRGERGRAPERHVPVWSGMADARLVAAGLGASVVGTEHVLIALMSGPEDDASRALRGAGLDFRAVAEALDAVSGTCRRGPALPLPAADVSEGVDRLLVRAADRSEQDRFDGAGDEVDDRDVLSALLDENDTTVAALVMSYVGARRRTLGRLADQASPASPARPRVSSTQA